MKSRITLLRKKFNSEILHTYYFFHMQSKCYFTFFHSSWNCKRFSVNLNRLFFFQFLFPLQFLKIWHCLFSFCKYRICIDCPHAICYALYSFWGLHQKFSKYTPGDMCPNFIYIYTTHTFITARSSMFKRIWTGHCLGEDFTKNFQTIWSKTSAQLLVEFSNLQFDI